MPPLAADITNPEAIKFSNEQARPAAEKIRDIKIDIDDALLRWHGGEIAGMFSTGGDVLIDGRAEQGVSVLTGADMTNFVAQLEAIKILLNGPGVMDVIHKLTVRSHN